MPVHLTFFHKTANNEFSVKKYRINEFSQLGTRKNTIIVQANRIGLQGKPSYRFQVRRKSESAFY